MFAQVLCSEFLKLRRSKVPLFTLAGLSLGPLGISLFMWIIREPGRAKQLGLLGTKAQLSGLEATWPAFASMLPLIVGIGGMLLLSFIVAYLFGREYEDGTAKNMLGLPVPRAWFVYAKLAVALVWWIALVAFVLAESALVGLALGLPGFSAQILATAIGGSLLAAGISYLLAPVIALVTIWGRGTMAPLGFALGMMALGNLLGHTGWSAWFPWSIVPSLIGMVSSPAVLPVGSYVVVALTFGAGVAGSVWLIRTADNTQ
ncbi:MAG TPA: ABC transporter permease [Coriobacteriia bacterium]|nr:ABC transporter permease [Coriobacteriia bacterium]